MGYRPVYARMSGVGRKGVVVLVLVGFGCVILSALFFGSLGPAERVAFQYGVPPRGGLPGKSRCRCLGDRLLCLMMLAIVLYSKEMPDFRNLPRPALLSLAHLALFPTLASYGLISFALKYIPGTAASITSMSEIIFAGVMAWAFLGEVPSPDQVRGGLLIVTAVLLLLMEGRISRSGTQGDKKRGPLQRGPRDPDRSFLEKAL
ncbi:MAG TPA: hypothetical protein DCM24_00705 [Synergistaceae bacterium]|nr:hypothetical protein [Synergistaceae bacterium]